MKRFLSIIISFALIVTIAAPYKAFAKADPTVKLDEAIEIAKKCLDTPTDNYNFNYNYNESQDGRNTWDLSWNSKSTNGGSMSASVDATTGDVVNINKWDSTDYQQTSKIPKYSKEQALKAAQEFAQRMQPDKFKETVLKDQADSMYKMPIYYSNVYTFNFTRQINGLDFLDNGITVSLDKNTLKVKSYNFNWDKGPFADPSKAISLEDAKKVFKDKLGIELAYNLVYNPDTKEQKAILVYTLKNGSNPIDALTGEVLKNGYFPRYSESDAVAAKTAANSKSLTPEEQKSVDASSKYISKDNAIEASKKYLPINDVTVLNNASLYVNSIDGTAAWNLSWNYNDPDKKISRYYNSQVDALTGKVMSFNMSGSDMYPDKDTPVKYTDAQAKDIAEAFLKGIEPDKFAKTEYKEQNYDIGKTDRVVDYNFNYVAKINGAACNFDTFNVTVNAFTGQVTGYNMNWNDTVAIPSADGAMSLDDAYKSFFDKVKLSMKYIKFYSYDEVKGQTISIKLAYTLDNTFGMFDAKTGTMLDYNGDPIKENKKVSFTDIKGNPAENDINLLIDLGIIDDQSSTFMPNSSIEQRDFIKLLVKSIQPGYVIYNSTDKTTDAEYNEYYNQAIQKNIITEKEKNPTAAVSKYDAARMIVKAMGVGFVADLGGIYNLSFKDAPLVPEKYKGYVAISSGLKIMSDEKGYFNGDKKISKGQTASFIVNYLKVDLNSK